MPLVAARDLAPLVADPLLDCLAVARLGQPEAQGVAAFASDQLVAGLMLGATSLTLGIDRDSAKLIAQEIQHPASLGAAIVGRQDEVVTLWAAMEQKFSCRSKKLDQPFLVVQQEPQAVVNPGVVVADLTMVPQLLPACRAMFQEEVGTEPYPPGGRHLFLQRLESLCAAGRIYAWIVDDEVVFKAEVGALTNDACQLQGVWTNPRFRHQGIATAGLNFVIRDLFGRNQRICLYVNSDNHGALNLYRKSGFVPYATYATVLL